METLTIKIKDSQNLKFFIELISKFNFITEIKTSKSDSINYNEPSIRWSIGKPSISDFAGIWEKSPKTLEQIREKSWKRNL